MIDAPRPIRRRCKRGEFRPAQWVSQMGGLCKAIYATKRPYRHVGRVCLGTDLADKRDGVDLCKLCDSLVGKRAIKNILALIEALVQHNTRDFDAFCLCEGRVRGGTKDKVLTHGLCDSVKGLVGGLVIGGKISDDNNLVSGLEVIESLGVEEGHGRHGLLGHVRDDSGLVSRVH